MQEMIEKDSTVVTGDCEVCMRMNRQVVRYWMLNKWRQICVDAYSCMYVYQRATKGLM